MSAFFVGYLATQIPSGFLSDTIGVRRTLTLAIGLAGVTCGLTGMALSFSEFLLFRFLNGLAAGCIFAPSSALLFRWFPSRERALAVSLFTTINLCGMSLSIALSPIISATFGSWRWSFWILSIPSLILIAPCFFVVRESPVNDTTTSLTDPQSGVKTMHFAAVLRWKWIWPIALLELSIGLARSLSLTWMPAYFVDEFGMNEVYAGAVASLSLVFTGVISSPFFGILSDRAFVRRSTLLFLGAFAPGLIGFGLSIVGSTSASLAIALAAIMGAFHVGWMFGPVMISEGVPLAVAGTATGIVNFCTTIGFIVGPVIFGHMLDVAGSFSLSWLALGVICTPLSLLMIPMMWLEKKASLTK